MRKKTIIFKMLKHICIYVLIILTFVVFFDGYAISEEISGAFGYRFGDKLDRSIIIKQVGTSYPRLLERYEVQPLLKNRDLDTYAVTLCRRTGEITNISGFKIFDDKNNAMVFLDKYKQFLENKYGAFNRPTSRKDDAHVDRLIKHPASLSVMVISKSVNPPEWAFMIMFDNYILTRQCGVPGI